MRSTSNKLYSAIQQGNRNFYPQAEITFLDGTKKTLGKAELTTTGNLISDSAGSSTFPLGVCVGKSIELNILNDRDQWKDYNFYGAKVFLRTCYDFEDSTEFYNIGTFTVINPTEPGITINLQAVDDIYKLDREYDPTTSRYPVSLGQLLRDICSACDISLLTGTFNNSDFVINEAPTDMTYRSMVGAISMLAGGNAKFDEYNRLSIKTYDLSVFQDFGKDGGIFDKESSSRYVTGDSLDGGSFNPWETGDEYDGGSFGDRKNIHFLSGLVNPSIATDDITITGIQIAETESEEKEIHLYGKTGYVLQLSNALLKDDQIDEALRSIGEKIVGLTFRSFSSNHVAMPMVEFMDLAYIFDWKSNSYQTVITDCDFNFFGFTELKCQSESPIIQGMSYSTPETVKVVQDLKKIQEKERSERQKAQQELAEELARSSGLYMTIEPQQDGSNIYYLHDKSSLSDSMIVWKMTAEAIGWSTDGGKTYPNGLDASGLAILTRIYTIGLDADYIVTGSIDVGKTVNGKRQRTFYADYATGEVEIVAKTFSLTDGSTIDSISQAKADALNKELSQDEIFNRLTGNRTTDGLYLLNKRIYLNASSIGTGSIDVGKTTGGTRKQTFYANYETGEVKIVADSFSLSNGSTIDSIAKGYADSLSKELSQEEIFNRLTGNRSTDGLYLQNGRIYLNASYIGAGTISASYINVSNLSSISANVGTLTSGVIRSSDYSYSSGNYSTSGIEISLTNNRIRSPQFYIANNGNAYFAGSLSAASGTFAGSLSAATGTFKGELSAATGTFSGSLSAATGTFNGNISAATGTFKGTVETSNGNNYCGITSGRLYGGYNNSDSGYVSFNNTINGIANGMRIASSTGIILKGPLLGVGDYTSYGGTGYYSEGYTGSIRVTYNMASDMSSCKSGTMQFIKGICVLCPE